MELFMQFSDNPSAVQLSYVPFSNRSCSRGSAVGRIVASSSVAVHSVIKRYHNITNILAALSSTQFASATERAVALTSLNSFYSAPQCSSIASAVLATAIPSVCLSVCPSVRLTHAGIVSKQRHVARCSLHCQIAKYV